jgi:Ca-activated chloride channel family protein
MYRDAVARLLVLGVVLLLIVAMASPSALAQPQPEPKPVPLPEPILIEPARRDQPVQIKNYKVKVEVENQIAQVVLELTFFNPNNLDVEETYLFPVPKGIVLSDLTLCTGNQCAEGKLMDAKEAQTKYEQIVRATRDPALLEYVGDRAFQVRVFPIFANGEQTVQIRFQTVLERAGNLVQFLYRLTGQREIEHLSVQVHLREDEPIANIYSPTHKITVQKLSDREVTASFEATQLRSAQDFLLFYALTEKELGTDLLTYRLNGQDGYFILLLSPALVEAAQTLPKDVIFVFDTSGSMAGEKIEQARASLKHAIGRLGPTDRFAIVSFSDAVREFRPRLVAMSEVDRTELEQFINSLDAAGGTNINEALLRGLDLFTQDERLKTVVFLTDGLPSSGEEHPAKIVQNVISKNKPIGARFFVFGVGYDVNTHLLDELSLEGRGFSTYVEPNQSIEREIAQFYDKVGSPILTDLKIDFTAINASVYDIYPAKLPDLYKGSQLQIVGRYSKSAQGKVILTGQRSGQEARYEIELNLTEISTTHNFLPKLWASRKIGYLLDQIRLKGESQELVQSVKALAQKFGIVTPYTAYFAAPAEAGASPTQLQNRSNSSCFNCVMSSAPQAVSGQSSVQYSKSLDALKEGYVGSDLSQSIYEKDLDIVFDNEAGIWKPDGYSGQDTIKVKFNSDAYFWLVQNSKAKSAFKLGEQVIIPVESHYIEVASAASKEGFENPTDLAKALQNAGIELSEMGTGNENQNVQSQTSHNARAHNEPNAQTVQSNQDALVALGVVALVAVAGLMAWMMRR